MEQYTCNVCKSVCDIDGDYPKFFAWCEFCETYASGFRPDEYAANLTATKTDNLYDRIKEHGTGILQAYVDRLGDKP